MIPQITLDDDGVIVTWPNKLSIQSDKTEGVSYAIFQDGHWWPGTYDTVTERNEAEKEIAEALRD